MVEATITEFPFVAQLPKREKSKLRKLWDHFEACRAITEQKGMLVPMVAAAALLGVSRQRVQELARDGRFEVVQLGNQVFITEKDLLAYAQSERKTGRPCGPTNMREVVKLGVRTGVDTYRHLMADSKTSK